MRHLLWYGLIVLVVMAVAEFLPIVGARVALKETAVETLLRVTFTRKHALAGDPGASMITRRISEEIRSHAVLTAVSKDPSVITIEPAKRNVSFLEWIDSRLAINVESSDRIRLTVTTPDAHQGVAILNSLIAAYFKEHSETRPRAIARQIVDLQRICDLIADKLCADINRLEDFVESVEPPTTAYFCRRSPVSTLIDMKMEVDDARAEMARINAAIEFERMLISWNGAKQENGVIPVPGQLRAARFFFDPRLQQIHRRIKEVESIIYGFGMLGDSISKNEKSYLLRYEFEKTLAESAIEARQNELVSRIDKFLRRQKGDADYILVLHEQLVSAEAEEQDRRRVYQRQIQGLQLKTRKTQAELERTLSAVRSQLDSCKAFEMEIAGFVIELRTRPAITVLQHPSVN